MRISVFGIGYVGAVTSGCLAHTGHHVIAVDVDPHKVDLVNRGKAPMVERNLSATISTVVEQGLLRATTDAQDAVQTTDISLICVGTPSDEDGRLDYKYLRDVCTIIGKALQQKESYHIVVFRSTMLPRSVEKQMIPLLEEVSGKKVNVDFGVGYNPEFLREGIAIADYFNPTQIIVGAAQQKDAEKIMSIYDGIDAPRSLVTLELAEALKYMSNIWRAHKISFANEMGNLLQLFDVDSYAAMEIFAMDKRINLGPSFLKPGFAFGGSCLPKDIRAMRAHGHDHGVKTPVMDALLQANEVQIDKALEMIVATKAKHVLMLGLTFKPDTDDLRESPFLTLAYKIAAHNIDLKIVDPTLDPNNTGYTQAKLSDAPQIHELLMKAGDINWQNIDLIVLSHTTNAFYALVNEAPRDIPMLALARPQSDLLNERRVIGICW